MERRRPACMLIGRTSRSRSNKRRNHMSFEVNQSKTYSQSLEAVQTAALGAVSGLEGKILKQSENRIEAKFDKKILGKVLGDRTQIEIVLSAAANGESQVNVTVYPLDPVGRKLMFGARKGVAQTVISWFWAHLEHRLK